MTKNLHMMLASLLLFSLATSASGQGSQSLIDSAPRNSDAPGLGVDRKGNPVIDPTTNVLQLVRAAIERQDDLRAAEARRTDELRALEMKHIEMRLAAETRRAGEQDAMRADYAEKLSSAEKSRIDAIRAVDVNAVAVASQRAADQASVLAGQVTQSAEALRALVASTASTVAASQQQLANTLNERISKLEQAQYTGAGRSAMADPAMTQMVEELKALRQAQSTSAGKDEGISAFWAVLIGAVGLGAAVIAIMSRTQQQPQVVYVSQPDAGHAQTKTKP